MTDALVIKFQDDDIGSFEWTPPEAFQGLLREIADADNQAALELRFEQLIRRALHALVASVYVAPFTNMLLDFLNDILRRHRQMRAMILENEKDIGFM